MNKLFHKIDLILPFLAVLLSLLSSWEIDAAISATKLKSKIEKSSMKIFIILTVTLDLMNVFIAVSNFVLSAISHVFVLITYTFFECYNHFLEKFSATQGRRNSCDDVAN